MTLPHRDAYDLLEAYVLGTLSADEAGAVAAHADRCAICRAEVDRHVEVVEELAVSLPEREPSPGLRERILAAAAAEAHAPRGRTLLRPAWGLALALVLAAGAGTSALMTSRGLQETAQERDEYLAVARAVSEGGRWWPMTATAQFEGTGGSLIVSRRDERAFVLVHDLRPSAQGRYAVWLIRSDGSWVRAANFAPTTQDVQRVALTMQVTDFVQCAVTIEQSDTGKRAGPLVMQSRVFTP